MSQLSEAVGKIKLLSPTALNPGVSDSEIDRLLQHFPFELPDEVYEFYRLSDGLNQDDNFSLFQIFSLSTAISNYQYYCSDYERYSEDWFPLVILEDHLLVMPCIQKPKEIYNLIDLGDDFMAAGSADDESSSLWEFRTLTATVVWEANELDRNAKRLSE